MFSSLIILRKWRHDRARLKISSTPSSLVMEAISSLGSLRNRGIL